MGEVDRRRDRRGGVPVRRRQGAIFLPSPRVNFLVILILTSVPTQHIDRNFIADFVKSVRAETQRPKMFAVGEFWKDSIEDLEAYLEALGTQVRFLLPFPSPL